MEIDSLTIDEVIEFYDEHGFDMVPVVRNGKAPIEESWTEKNHKDKSEWYKWIEDGINIGVKTGKMSSIIVIDFDSAEIPKQFTKWFDINETLHQKTNKGWHVFYKYEAELPNCNLRKFGFDVEIKSDGAQVVLFPSKVEDSGREIHLKDITEIPWELKDFLISIVGKPKEIELPEFPIENFSISDIKEGSRNNFMMHIGGILRKELNIQQTEKVLGLFNSKFITPPLNITELRNIIRMLDRYEFFDEKEFASKIYQYMRLVEESTPRDIREALGYKREHIDKCLNYLIREGYVYKKHRIYVVTQKVIWNDSFINASKEIEYKIPYFDHVAKFRDGDMAIIGGNTGTGKTHIAMNMIKELVDQGVKPYYISLESGSRWADIARELEMKTGDFYRNETKKGVFVDPENVELEDNAFTIIDWLLPSDYAQTDKIYKRFVAQLCKHGGLLFVFVQLKPGGDFFASSMIEMFPALVCKFLYEKDENGISTRLRSKFVITKIREAKNRGEFVNSIPLEYIPTTGRLIIGG